MLGATVRMPTLAGTVSLRIPPGTTTGQQFRLRGKGLPAGKNAPGDLYAIVAIAVPAAADPKEKALWEQLAATSTFHPRK